VKNTIDTRESQNRERKGVSVYKLVEKWKRQARYIKGMVKMWIIKMAILVTIGSPIFQ
jgi:hypothetical protein